MRFLMTSSMSAATSLPELREAARATRKIGLGVMGLAEPLAALGIPYDSEEAAEHYPCRIQQAVERPKECVPRRSPMGPRGRA